MPRRLEFERDLINVNIRRKDFNQMALLRWHNEPNYSLIGRIWAVHNKAQEDTEYENEILRQSVQTWMKRALDAEAKLPKQKTLE